MAEQYRTRAVHHTAASLNRVRDVAHVLAPDNDGDLGQSV